MSCFSALEMALGDVSRGDVGGPPGGDTSRRSSASTYQRLASAGGPRSSGPRWVVSGQGKHPVMVSSHPPRPTKAPRTCSSVQYPCRTSHSLSWTDALCTSSCDEELAARRASSRYCGLSGTVPPPMGFTLTLIFGVEMSGCGWIQVDSGRRGGVEDLKLGA